MKILYNFSKSEKGIKYDISSQSLIPIKMKPSKDEMHDLLHTYKKHPGTTQFELAENMNIVQHLDSERRHRTSTCTKYNEN